MRMPWGTVGLTEAAWATAVSMVAALHMEPSTVAALATILLSRHIGLGTLTTSMAGYSLTCRRSGSPPHPMLK
jgi:hypothetical protein